MVSWNDFIDMLWRIARSSACFRTRIYFDGRCMPCSHSSSPSMLASSTSMPRCNFISCIHVEGCHFTKCPDITEETKAELKSFKRSNSGKDVDRYWIDSCHRKGLVDCRICTSSKSSELEVILLKSTRDDLLKREIAAGLIFLATHAEERTPR